MINDNSKTKQNKKKRKIMNKITDSMFDTLKNTMSDQRSGGNFKDILKTNIGNNYIVRLIPNLEDVSKTIHHYFHHGWKSRATGQFVSCVCPTTTGQRCPICEERVRLYRGDDEDKANARMLGRKEQWLVNALIVDDPDNQENNGSIKIIRYGKQLDKVIRSATEGVDKDEFGIRVFQLSEDGCNLRIAVEKNDGGYPTYVSSKFLRESAIDGMTDEKAEELYEGLFNLEKVLEQKSPEQAKEILDTHFFCVSSSVDEPVINKPEESTGTEVTDSKEVAEEATPEPTAESTDEATDDTGSEDSDDSVQKKLDELMEDL